MHLLKPLLSLHPKSVFFGPSDRGSFLQELCLSWPSSTIDCLFPSSNQSAPVTHQVRRLFGSLDGWIPTKQYDGLFIPFGLPTVANKERLLQRLVKAVTPGGTLALAMPIGLKEGVLSPFFDFLTEPKWQEFPFLQRVQELCKGTEEFILEQLSSMQQVKTQIYEQSFWIVGDGAGQRLLYKWGMQQFIERGINDELCPLMARFRYQYERRLTKRFTIKPGIVELPMKWLFVWAH